MDDKGRMTKWQIESIINTSKSWLRTSLDTLEYYVSITPKELVQKFIKEHYENRRVIAYQCYHSNKIEGSKVTLRDTEKILECTLPETDRYTIRDVNEVKGFINAYKKSVRYLGISTLTVPIIKDLHMELMAFTKPEIGGRYRVQPATIYGHEFIKFVMPDKIDASLSRAIELYNIGVTQNPPLFEACKFKINFINVHPFSDGNGRTSRLLLNCMLISNGYIPIIIKENQRMGYKRAMQIGYQCQTEDIKGGYLPLLSIIVDSLIDGYKEILRKEGIING